MVVPPILIVIFTIYVNAIDRSTELLRLRPASGCSASTSAGTASPVSSRCSRARCCYYVFRAIYGGPATPSSEAGNEALALAEAEAAEDAA